MRFAYAASFWASSALAPQNHDPYGSLRTSIAGQKLVDAKHAFANETADSKNLPMIKYDPAAAEIAWGRTMPFLAKHLK